MVALRADLSSLALQTKIAQAVREELARLAGLKESGAPPQKKARRALRIVRDDDASADPAGAGRATPFPC